MIDYYETRSQPITRVMVLQAYRKIRANKGSAGIDNMKWSDLDKDLDRQLYKLWNRLSSGSYFPQPVRECEISKSSGEGKRMLGIPTILDRVAQEVVKTHLERIVDPQFHKNSFGYRPGRSCHQAVEQSLHNVMINDWVIDIDIKGFFDNIDHELLMKAVSHYCKDSWVLLYISRWLKAGSIQQDGMYCDKVSGTPQGGVISPLLSNIFLHVVFDKWMEKDHPEKPFERYADDIVVHCKTEKQATFLLKVIAQRMKNCKLKLHPVKSKIVNLRGFTQNKYPRSFDFLGFTIRPLWSKTSKGMKVMVSGFMSRKSKTNVLAKLRGFQIHKWRKPIEVIAEKLKPVIQGVINYYGKFWTGHMYQVWYYLNQRLLKWVKWEKGLYKKQAIRWLQLKCKEKPRLFPHWQLVHP